MGKVKQFGSSVEFEKHVGQRAPVAHKGSDYFYIKGSFLDVTTGASDAGSPVKLNSSGMIDTSMTKVITRARAYLGTAQNNVTHGSWVKVLLDNETYDSGSNFDKDTNHRFVAPVAGYYHVSACVLWYTPISDVVLYSGIYVTGSLVAKTYCPQYTANYRSCPISDILYVAASGYIELYCLNNVADDSADVIDGSDCTFMSVHLLSVS